MRIAGTSVTMAHGAFEIYLSGCLAPHCIGCHNPELWDFTKGVCWSVESRKLLLKIHGLPAFISAVWVLGGEPLDSEHDQLEEMLQGIKRVRPDLQIVLFTKYRVLPEWLWNYVNLVKIGMYDANKTHGGPFLSHGIPLASANQIVLTQEQYRRMKKDAEPT